MKKLNTPVSYNRESPYVGYCHPCDKRVFLCRKAARRAGRLTGTMEPDGSLASHRPRAYRCPISGCHWHVGHVPDAVRNGTITRTEWHEARAGRR